MSMLIEYYIIVLVALYSLLLMINTVHVISVYSGNMHLCPALVFVIQFNTSSVYLRNCRSLWILSEYDLRLPLDNINMETSIWKQRASQ